MENVYLQLDKAKIHFLELKFPFKNIRGKTSKLATKTQGFGKVKELSLPKPRTKKKSHKSHFVIGQLSIKHTVRQDL